MKMVASTDIKFYVHSNKNAPQLQNQFGCMIDVLDACLVNGFGSQSVATLTASGTTVTATYGSAHNYLQYQVTKIAGVNQTEFNGEHRILTVPDANTITFQLASTPSVTTATGTITSSLPSLGWEKPFSSTNEAGGGKAAYRSKNTLLPSRPFLRVVDELDPAYTATYAKYAKVGVVEDMSDIDTMMGIQAPFDASKPNKNWVGTGSGASAINGWARWYYAQQYIPSGQSDASTIPAGTRHWILIGNSDYFYVLPTLSEPTTNLATQNVIINGFGTLNRFYDSDNGAVFLTAVLRDLTAIQMALISQWTGIGNGGAYTVLYKNIEATASTVAVSDWLNGQISGSSNIYSSNLKIPLLPYVLNEAVSYSNGNRKIPRGIAPNIYAVGNSLPFANKQVFSKDNAAFMPVNYFTSTGTVGQMIFKIGDL